MAEFNVFTVYMLLIFIMLGSTSIADPAQRDETMTIVLDLNDNPEYEVKYIQDNVDLTDSPNVGSAMNLIKNDSFAATPEGNNVSNATETPSEPTKDDQVTKSTTKTMTTNTRTTTTTNMTNSTTVTSTSTPTSMSATSTSSVTISTVSGTRN